MKKQIIKLNESQLNDLVTKMVTESVKHILKENEYTECGEYYNHYLEETDKNINEAESGGWVVDSSEAQEAYNLFANSIGEAEANAAIVRALGDNALSEVLAYLFRMYDFREWKSKFQ